ncbi:MAG: hypothetical protein QOI77_2881 [Blastocatellia bacterium]|nr:hypothetical protein [Blastocatellia bacterium]
MKDTCHSARDFGGLMVGICALLFSVMALGALGAHAQNPAASQTPSAAQSPAPSRSATATPIPSPTPTPVNWSTDPMLKRFVWRGIGPASMGGRIDDIAAVESNPYIFYVGFATGGVWKTVNNGTTFTPIFDTYSTASIGDIAIASSNPDTVWVGTGEPNNRQSSSFGDGIYKSTDGGKTFAKMGLENSQTIARIVIDPKDANIVYVAVLGHLFGPNKERGIYKTTDGGKTWNNVKFIDEDTGFTDLVMDASDSKTLYAASYQRRRTSWGFNGGGPGSGIWKTTDAGKSWTKLQGNGLPEGLLGRIGIDVSRSNPNVLYAQMEVGASVGTGGEEQAPPGGSPTPTPTPTPASTASPVASPTPTPPDPKKSGVWRSDDKGKTWRVVATCFNANNCPENNRSMYYSQIRVDPSNPENVFVGGLNFSKSTDGGKKFTSLQQGIAHSDHHAIWVDPKNGNHLLIGNDGGLDVSYDQGATWEFINTIPAAQFYAIAADMRRPYYVYGGLQDNGSWGGPSQTRSNAGITNADWFRTGGGDGFYSQADPNDYNIVYSESQNGSMSRTDLRTGRSVSIRPRAAARRPGGGGGGGAGRRGGAQPGASPSPTPEDPQAALAAFAAQQGFGGFGGQATSNIVPAPSPGEQFRFYWNTPIVMSPHNSRILYVGGDRFFKSLDRGDTWTASADLTKHVDRNKLSIMGVKGTDPMASKNDGYTSFSYIVTIAESPMMPGVLWVGTDDGNIQFSKDGGANWANVSKNVPGIGEMYHINRVEPSHYDAGTCYLAVDGHRFDDLKPYLFVTRDYGATWTSIVGNLPVWGTVNVVREDPKNKDLLYAGTEFGLYISLDGGREWKPLMSGLPTVRVDDILVHPRDNDLIVGTHGRGIYILDDISALQQLTSGKVLDKDVFLFDVRPGTQWLNDVRLGRYTGGAKIYRGNNPVPGTAISYYLKAVPTTDVKITIADYTGKVIRTIVGTKEIGINRVQWNLRGDVPARGNLPGFGGGGGGGGGFGGFFNIGPPIDPGTYFMKLSVNGKDFTTKVVIETDPGMQF